MKTLNTKNGTRRLFTLLLGECAIVAFLGFYIYWQYLTPFPGLKLGIYVDAMSFVPVTGVILIVMVATGSLKELGRAFQYCVVPDSGLSAEQVGKAVQAVKLSMITAVLTGGIVTLFDVITVFYTSLNFYTVEGTVRAAGPDQILIGSSMSSVLCGLLVAILFLPIYGRLKKVISSH